MTLSTGDRLVPYEILSLIGAGGMGGFHRARDTRLGRDVAVKENVIKRGLLIEKKAFRIVRDFRRTAARNLSRVGVPERVIMQLCGWKTRSVCDRYSIVPEADLRDGLAKLAGP